MLGMQMRKIQVGIGPLLWSGDLTNGLIWEWRLSPHGGFMYASPRSTKNFRVRQLIFILGGPLVDALVLWTTYQAILFFFGGLVAAVNQSAAGLIATILFWCVAISAVAGLLPLKFWLGKQTLWTDGYWLLRLTTTSRARLASLAFNPDWKKALELFQSNLPDGLGPSPSVQVDHNPNVIQIFQEQREHLTSQLLPKAER
jgi:hypothetical protein